MSIYQIARKKHLKVKIKSLAAEAKIIRREEQKTQDNIVRGSLYSHRVGIVRDEARLSQLAYAFLRNRTYKSIEPKSKKFISVSKLSRIIKNFGGLHDDDLYLKVEKWLQL